MRYRSAEMKELTAAMLVSLARRIDPVHRAELLHTYPNLTAWARSRLSLPGSAWACVVGGEVVFILGLVTYGAAAWVWLAGVKGWSRYVKHAGQLWRAILASRIYQQYICDVRADNQAGKHFAEYAGFALLERRGDVLYYGMAS